MLSDADEEFLEKAIELSRKGMLQGNGGPFGCVVVKNGKIVGEGHNMVTSTNDPTAHAEIVAIRDACRNLNNYQLSGCDIFCSCEPCPMCMGAIYWARPERVIFANTRFEAAAIEFDDAFIYDEINMDLRNRRIPFIHMPRKSAQDVFEQWRGMEGKKLY